MRNGQEGRRRWTPALLAGLGALVGAGLGLSTNLASSLVTGSWLDRHEASVWSATGAFVIAAALLAVLAARASGSMVDDAESDVTRALLGAVRQDRQQFLDQALGVRYRADPARVSFTDPEPGDLPDGVESLLLHWQAVEGRHAGSITTVAAFYLAQPTGRLVVLGQPGAGKSVLLSQLVLDLIDEAGNGPVEPVVPVVLSLTSFDLDPADASEVTARRFDGWVAQRLDQDYGVPRRKAATLVRQRRVLPVLDGLDEMDEMDGLYERHAAAGAPRAAALIQALNMVRHPVVLACREDDYRAALTDARHVVLRALAVDDVADHLAERLGGVSKRLPARWQPVVEALRASRGGTAAAIFANPWLLFLAVSHYRDPDRDPTELLTMSLEQARAHLLAALIPSTVVGDERAARQSWSAADVHAWLVAVAGHQSRTGAGTDIRLHDLWRMGGRRYPRWVPALVAAASPAIFGFFAVVGSPTLLSRVVTGLLAFAFVVGLGRRALRPGMLSERFDLSLRFSTAQARESRNVVLLGLGWGLILALSNQPESSYLAVTVFALLAGLLPLLRRRIHSVRSPGQLAGQGARHSLALGLAAGLSFGVIFGLLVLQTFDPVLGLVLGGLGATLGGLTATMTIGSGHAWLRYWLGSRAAARRGRLPRRPARFLDWCLAVGLIRMSGHNLQFRHRQLQDWLNVEQT